MKTTLNAIRKHEPCASGWSKLLAHLGKTKADDEPLALITILDSNGLNDALWALRAVDGHDAEMRLFAIDCAARVVKVYEARYPGDKRASNAIKTAKAYLKGKATMDDLIVARDAAWAATWAAARDAAGDAAWAAAGDAAWDAAGATARDAAWDAARAAAWDAARAAARDVAWAAARAAARDVAWAAERKWQEKRFRKMCADVSP